VVTGVRRVVLWVMSTVTVLVLLFGYPTSTSGPSVAGGQTAITGSSSGTVPASARTVTGPAVSTRWGPVQVEVTVDGGAITDVAVVRYPEGNRRDREINDRALPVLIADTLDVQSADVDMVTGATVTSEGYVGSLQAALDEAGL
jgi:uncharacterized protein with FMN-binding domain